MKKIIIIFSIILIQSCSTDKKDILMDMNNIEMPEYEEIGVAPAKDTLKVLVIGNSITSHGILKKIGWTHKSGMAATSTDKDYVHLLYEDFKKNNPTRPVVFRYANYSAFERSPKKMNFNDSKIKNLYKFNPEYVIYQLGDNTTKANVDEFGEVSVEFLDGFKVAKKFVLSPYFMTFDNYRVMRKVAKLSRSSFIDISYISNNKKYTANQDPNSIKSGWKVEGIGAHPGDLGMLEISQLILKTISQENQKLSLQ